MHPFRALFALLFPLALSAQSPAQTGRREVLRSQIQMVADSSGAKIGVGVLGLDFSDSLTVNGGRRFPMQSVFKLPLALAVLQGVDAGRFSLEQRLRLSREGLDTATWSPMLTDFAGPVIDISVADLLRYSVSKSDNNACDELFRLVGGTATVDRCLHRAGIDSIAIRYTEAGMKARWSNQYANWCTPAAMLQLLQKVAAGSLLSGSSNAFLMKALTETETGPRRLKGGLPAGTVVAHKTGTSGTSRQGLTAAINDAGIVTLPDGRRYAIVVFASDFRGGPDKGERINAAISRLVWDYLTRP